MRDLEQYLRRETGCEWKEISYLYANFKKHSGLLQFCVLTADNPVRSLRPRFYIPEDGNDVNNPGRFIDRVNAKKPLINDMPWVQIDLDDLPALVITRGATTYTASLSISLSGTIKLRKLGSLNSQTIRKSVFTSIGSEAKDVIGGILSQESMNASLDLMRNTFTFGTQLVSDQATVNVNLGAEPNGSISITADLIPTRVSKIIKGWQIQGEFGYKVVGEMSPDKTPPSTRLTIPTTDYHKSVMIVAEDATPIVARALFKVAVRVIFVLGEAAVALI